MEIQNDGERNEREQYESYDGGCVGGSIVDGLHSMQRNDSASRVDDGIFGLRGWMVGWLDGWMGCLPASSGSPGNCAEKKPKKGQAEKGIVSGTLFSLGGRGRGKQMSPPGTQMRVAKALRHSGIQARKAINKPSRSHQGAPEVWCSRSSSSRVLSSQPVCFFPPPLR
jgi:hypothetical protein